MRANELGVCALFPPSDISTAGWVPMHVDEGVPRGNISPTPGCRDVTTISSVRTTFVRSVVLERVAREIPINDPTQAYFNRVPLFFFLFELPVFKPHAEQVARRRV